MLVVTSTSSGPSIQKSQEARLFEVSIRRRRETAPRLTLAV